MPYFFRSSFKCKFGSIRHFNAAQANQLTKQMFWHNRKFGIVTISSNEFGISLSDKISSGSCEPESVFKMYKMWILPWFKSNFPEMVISVPLDRPRCVLGLSVTTHNSAQYSTGLTVWQRRGEHRDEDHKGSCVISCWRLVSESMSGSEEDYRMKEQDTGQILTRVASFRPVLSSCCLAV